MKSVFQIWRAELRRMVSLKPVRSVLIGAAILYAAFYPQPYVNEALRGVPIVLVDLDRSSISRDFARRTEATEGVSIQATAADLATAERQVLARKAYGIAGGGAGHPISRVIGKLLAYLTLQTIVLPVYLIGLPYLYNVPRLGSLEALGAVAVPFVLAVSSLAMVLAALCRTPIRVQLATAALGLPFFFVAGFSWPTEAIPPALQALAGLVPSSTAIEAFVAVNQMGAELADLQPQLARLWGLAAGYTVLAMLLNQILGKRAASEA